MTLFPWTQSGLELLSTIQQYVEENGGRTELLKAVLMENSSDANCPDSMPKLTARLIDLYKTVPRKQIPGLLDISETRVATMLTDLFKTGMLKNEYPQSGRSKRLDMEFLRDNYQTMRVCDIARHLNRPDRLVRNTIRLKFKAA